jgi:hypothetical protein
MAISDDTLVGGNPSTSSSGGAAAFTKSDTNVFAHTPTGLAERQRISRGVSTDLTGDYSITMADGVNVTCHLIAGVIHPIAARRVRSTDSDGGNIVAWF